MPRHLLFLGLAVLVAGCFQASACAAPGDAGLASLLRFEPRPEGGLPAGWHGGPANTIGLDSVVTHGGKWAARICRTPDSARRHTSLTNSIPINFSGGRIELRGFIRTENVSDFAGFWMQENGVGGQMEFGNMEGRHLKGTTDWNEYSITLPLNPDARTLLFGFLLAGSGTAWTDGLQLLVDGNPVWQAPKTRPETAIDRDHEFDHGSKIVLSELTAIQVENLARLSQVWGFLKYHHPSVTSGRLHWDYELFRIMPAILAANDREGANEVLKHWVDGLGPLGPTTPSEPITSDIFLPADTSWLGNRAVLGPALSERLRTIYAARPKVEASQFYVSRSQNAWNPEFTHELAYQRLRFPDAGYQLLALFRFWNIIRYWYPYRNLLDENWDAVLQEFIPRIGLAKDAGAFQLQLFALMTKVHDTHASLWSSTNLLPPVGDGQIPVVVRFVEGHPVVANLIQGESPGDLQRGDAIVAMDGVPVERLLAEWSPYYAASNEPTRLRDIARFMGRGPIGPAKLRIRRGNELLDVETLRAPVGSLPIPIEQTHDLPGPAFRLLSKDVAYLKLSAVKASAIPAYLEQAAGTKGWILDIRNYPSEFVVFALGSHFIDRPTKFARFTIANLADPGVFTLTKPVSLNPKLPQYAGKIVILVDEVSQSLSEYTAMAFRAAPEAIVIGSTTAGADGDVSSIPLPGGFLSRISGVGIFYPNMRPTQRIGILPDIEVKPTLAGIREGRDEVLEEALRQILGPEVPSEKIRKMSMESD